VTERWIPLDRLLPSIPSVRLGDEGRKRVAHGQMLDASHVLDTGSASRSPGAWTRLIDEEGQLVALGTVDESGEFLHPAVVLI
jgi:tRNA U55 pseudouridine synthase TruB